MVCDSFILLGIYHLSNFPIILRQYDYLASIDSLMDGLLDTIGQILWYSMLATPFITIPVVWRHSKQRKAIKILAGLGLALLLSLVLGVISFVICMRNGLGPT
jgi:hypothetical protein